VLHILGYTASPEVDDTAASRSTPIAIRGAGERRSRQVDTGLFAGANEPDPRTGCVRWTLVCVLLNVSLELTHRRAIYSITAAGTLRQPDSGHHV
jgi:hypothetical protein